jgi:capsular polysaccharide transport system permease protein
MADLSPFSFSQSLKTQFRVIGALLMREILTRFGRHNIGFLWLFAEPALFTVGVTAIWMLTKMLHSSALPVAAFAITGYSSLLLWRNTVGRSLNAIEPNRSLLFHRQVRVFDLFYARILLEVSGATMSFFVLSIVFSTFDFGGMTWPADPLKISIAWFLLAWFAGALALFMGALAHMTELIERIWHVVAYLILPFSGVFYMVDWLPRSVQKIVLFVPIVHGVEMLRDGYFGEAVKTHYEVFYLATCSLVLSLFGLVVLKLVSRRVELS